MDSNDPPQMQPPPGVELDPARTESLSQYNVLCQVACLSLATTAIGLRVLTTMKVAKQWRLDDYTCCIAWASLMVYGSLITVMTSQYGGGVHMWNIPGSVASKFLYFNNIAQILYGPFIMVTKASILLLLSRIFAPQRKGLIYIAVHVLIWLNLIFYGAVTIVKVIQCIPRERIWDSSIDGNCIDLSAVLKTTGIFNTVSDLFILILPIRETWKLQMEIKQKLGVSAAFGIGLVALLASIFRLKVSFTESGNMDKTYYQLYILMWSEGEIAAGIICCCLLTLPALFRHYHRKRNRPYSDRQSRAYDMHGSDAEKGLPRRPPHRRSHSRTASSSKYLGKGEAMLFEDEYVGLATDPHTPNGGDRRRQRVKALPVTPPPPPPPPPPAQQRVVTTIRGDARSVLALDGLVFDPVRNVSELPVNEVAGGGHGIVKTVRIDQFGASPKEQDER